MKVENGRVVALRFCLQNSQGEVLESNLEGPSVRYLHGSGTILPMLEAELTGMSCGAEKTFLLGTGNGKGQPENDFSVRVIIDDICLPSDQSYSGMIPPVSQRVCEGDCVC